MARHVPWWVGGRRASLLRDPGSEKRLLGGLLGGRKAKIINEMDFKKKTVKAAKRE